MPRGTLLIFSHRQLSTLFETITLLTTRSSFIRFYSYTSLPGLIPFFTTPPKWSASLSLLLWLVSVIPCLFGLTESSTPYFLSSEMHATPDEG